MQNHKEFIYLTHPRNIIILFNQVYSNHLLLYSSISIAEWLRWNLKGILHNNNNVSYRKRQSLLRPANSQHLNIQYIQYIKSLHFTPIYQRIWGRSRKVPLQPTNKFKKKKKKEKGKTPAYITSCKGSSCCSSPASQQSRPGGWGHYHFGDSFISVHIRHYIRARLFYFSIFNSQFVVILFFSAIHW